MINTKDSIRNSIFTELDNLGIIYAYDKENDVFRYDSSVDGKITKIFHLILIKDDGCLFCSAIPFKVDIQNTKALDQLADFICRANFRETGIIEMDYDDGKLRYKYFLDCENSEPSRESIIEAIFTISVIAEQYTDILFDIAYRGLSADEAMEAVKEKLIQLGNNFENR